MSALVPQDTHLGSRKLGSCLVVGAAGTGAVFAGALVRLRMRHCCMLLV